MRTLFTTAASAMLTSLASAQPIVIDGNTADWPEGELVRCEDGWLKVRLDMGKPASLHALPEPLAVDVLLFDGTVPDSLEGLGMVGVTFSPPPPADGSRRWGPHIVAQSGGAEIEIDAMDLDLHVAPTAAASAYELRFGLDELVEVLASPAATLAMVRTPDAPTGAAVELCDTAPDTASVELPERPEAGVRVMAWNVLWSSPVESPDGFARVFDATRPDIVLFQEWDRGELSAGDVAAWMNEHAAWSEGDWSVSKPDAWGVAVATHHPVVAEGPEQLLAPGSRWDFPVRLASAVIDLPAGRTVIGSVHLKCCGSLGSDEDTRRLVESVAIRDTLIELTDLHDAQHVILGGDFNTSGTLAVLDVSAAGVDLDGSPLTYAEPIVTADEARYTFGRPGMNNVRTRLDWIAFSDSTLAATSAFVIDTARIDAPSLATMGLIETDSAASDHLPVVVDLIPID